MEREFEAAVIVYPHLTALAVACSSRHSERRSHTEILGMGRIGPLQDGDPRARRLLFYFIVIII